MPPFINHLISLLVDAGVIGKEQAPDSASVSVYNAGDCSPPILEHHDFERPVWIVALQSQQRLTFGQKFRTPLAGDFRGDFELALSSRSVLLLEGHSANVAKYAVPSVTSKHVFITLRRMRPGAREALGVK